MAAFPTITARISGVRPEESLACRSAPALTALRTASGLPSSIARYSAEVCFERLAAAVGSALSVAPATAPEDSGATLAVGAAGATGAVVFGAAVGSTDSAPAADFFASAFACVVAAAGDAEDAGEAGFSAEGDGLDWTLSACGAAGPQAVQAPMTAASGRASNATPRRVVVNPVRGAIVPFAVRKPRSQPQRGVEHCSVTYVICN